MLAPAPESLVLISVPFVTKVIFLRYVPAYFHAMKWPVKLLVSCCVAGVALALSVGFSRSLKAGSDGLSPMMDTIPHWYFFDLAENEHFKAAGLCDGCH